MEPISLGPEAFLDIPRLLETRLLIQANSGGGKSWALRRLLERSHGQVQQIVIDPEGEFGTLREQYDYVLAGEDGDCAAEPRSAHLLARKLLELQVSAICNIYELKAHERTDFVMRFLEALINAPKKLWHPVLVVLDEAHVYCPERGQSQSANAVIDLATRGRKRGMCAVLATQRLSKLRKDAAAELNNVMIGRTGLDVDIARAGDALGMNRNARQELRYLEPGAFYGFGPAFQFKPMSPPVQHFWVGGVTTSHPRSGGRIAVTAPPPTDRIRELLSDLTDLPEAAEAEARTVKELKAEIRSLQGKIRAASRTADGEALAKAKAETASLRETLEATRATLKQAMDSDREAIARVRAWEAYGNDLPDRIVSAIRERQPGYLPAPAARPAPAPDSPPERRLSGDRLKIPSDIETSSSGDAAGHSSSLTGRQQAILDSLAKLDSMSRNRGPATRTNVAVFAAVSSRSSAFRNNLGRLRSLGFIEYPSKGFVELTEDGRALARWPSAPISAAELREQWLGQVTEQQARILRVLFSAHPNKWTDREDLAREAGVSPLSSAFRNNLGRLRSFGLIDYATVAGGPSKGVRAAVDLFDG